MASSLSMQICEPCDDEGKKTKAISLCRECDELLCAKCSRSHLKFKTLKDHKLISLDPVTKRSKFYQNTSRLKPENTVADKLRGKLAISPTTVDRLTSDFRERANLSGQPVSLRGSVVDIKMAPVQSQKRKPVKDMYSTRPKTSKNLSKKQSPSTSTDQHRLKKATEEKTFGLRGAFDMKRVWVAGILCISEGIIIVDNSNKRLKLFSYDGRYITCTDVQDETWGITSVLYRLFATCGWSKRVYLWTIQGCEIISNDVSLSVDHIADGIHYNKEYYCVLHRLDRTVTILDKVGERVREITMQEACGRTFKFGCDIHMEKQTHNIYVPCDDEDGVLCMTVEGKALWFTSFSCIPKGITEVQGVLCVADYGGTCVHLITKQGQYIKKLLDKEDLGGKPRSLSCGQNDKLYVCFDYLDERRDKINVYKIDK